MALRIILFLLFLGNGGKSCSLRQYDYCKKNGKEYQWRHGIQQDGSDHDLYFRRKQKPKGITLALISVKNYSLKFVDAGSLVLFVISDPFCLVKKQLVTALRGPPQRGY